MRILITGATGMLGSDVHAACEAAGHEPLAFARAGLDITDQGAVQAAVARARPDAVINCAAWTDVDGAEEHYEQALAANGAGAGHVARAAAANGAWTVHVSSDYVFDGRKTAPYLESDDTAPLSAYGRSKLEGEREVRGAAPERHTIVRSSWLFGAAGRCFPEDDPEARRRARRDRRRRRPGRLPDLHGPPRAGARRSRRGPAARRAARRVRRQLLVV